MKKLVLLVILLASLSSCVKISHFDVKSVNDLKLSKMTMNGADVLLDVTFESNKTVKFNLTKLELDLSIKGNNVANIVIPHKVNIITNDTNVKIPLTININGGILGAATLLSRLDKDIDSAVINGYIVVKKGLLVKKYKINNVPVKDFYQGISSEKFNIRGLSKFLR